jgi:hypothetical protein
LDSQLRTFRDLIACWPTIVAFAEDIGVGYEAARKMKDRCRIDQGHWVALLEAAKSRRILDKRGRPILPKTLMEMSARREPEPKKSTRNEMPRAAA